MNGVSSTMMTMAAIALSAVLLGLTASSSQASEEAGPDPRTSTAWQWIKSQTGTGTPVTTTSTITADADYPSAWTGPVSGSFDLRDVPPPSTRNGSPIIIEEPVSLSGTYTGVLSGRVELPSAAGRWIINVLRLTDAGTAQAQLQTVADADGVFTLDLGQALVHTAGSWGFQVLDSTDGYAQVGERWPQPDTLEGLEVRAVVVTDIAYVVGHAPAHADNTFSFDASQPGVKVFQLIDTATGDVLAEHAPSTGLVRSYDAAVETPGHGRTYTYDQALAVITADAIGDEALAQTLTSGLLRLQSFGGSDDGAFVTSAAALNPEAAQREYRTGNHSIATYALLRRLVGMAASDADYPTLVSAATRGIDWLLAQQQSSGMMDGLLTGGRGATLPDGSFDPSVAIGWASTEHNLDAWHTLRLAASVLDRDDVGSALTRLEAAILGRLWDPVTSRFHQGWQPDGADPTPMLDLNSWGAIFLQKAGHPGLAADSLDRVADFSAADAAVQGYSPRLPGTSRTTVWFEGSAGVALAQHRMGQTSLATATLEGLDAAQSTSGSFPEASRLDDSMDMSTDPAVAATAWILLAQQAVSGHPTMWDE